MHFGRRQLRALPVPPFGADPASSVPVRTSIPDDPAAVLAGRAVTLPAALQMTYAATGLPVWTMPVEPGYPATEVWESVRAAHPHTGLWPVLASDRTLPQTAAEPAEVPPPPVASDGATWMAGRAADVLDELPRGPAPAWTSWEDFDWADALAALDDPLDRLMLVPAGAGWLVPGLLGWDGAVNVGLGGAEHATVLRRWAGRWQAELVALQFDVLTCAY